MSVSIDPAMIPKTKDRDDPMDTAITQINTVRSLLAIVQLAASSQEDHIEGVDLEDVMQIALDHLSDARGNLDTVRSAHLKTDLEELNRALNAKPKEST